MKLRPIIPLILKCLLSCWALARPLFGNYTGATQKSVPGLTLHKREAYLLTWLYYMEFQITLRFPAHYLTHLDFFLCCCGKNILAKATQGFTVQRYVAIVMEKTQPQAGKARQQEPRLAGHMTSTLRKQNATGSMAVQYVSQPVPRDPFSSANGSTTFPK